ncbi:hypothetical protein FLAG1_01700 [Fusarium langsethiae]|uniref:Uncharacterized protein n=1 Tax=Fusarium langsethiae TaxID=179993 RepID=A0A0M9F3M2_FUSLA|nr:hypothetical protein FLAG1_01700 [Fusarium langsethiae]
MLVLCTTGPNLGPLLCVCVCVCFLSSYNPLRRRRRRRSPPSTSTISTVIRSYKGSLGSQSDFSSFHNRLLFGFCRTDLIARAAAVLAAVSPLHHHRSTLQSLDH